MQIKIKRRIPKSVRRLVRIFLALFSSAYAPTPYLEAKRSKADNLSDIRKLFDSQIISLPTAIRARIEARRSQLEETLSGEIVETSYRHEIGKMDAAEVCEAVSSDLTACALLYSLIKIRHPKNILELGSAFGLGSLSVALAIADSPASTLDGIEYESWRADLAQSSIVEILAGRGKIHPGRIEDVLPLLIEHPNRCFDFAFVDAMHTCEATVGYHNLLRDAMPKGGLAIYDDINWSYDMGMAWKRIVDSDFTEDAILVANRWGLVQYKPRI